VEPVEQVEALFCNYKQEIIGKGRNGYIILAVGSNSAILNNRSGAELLSEMLSLIN
jgi:hypothetical protein